jgi:hypothetical protein
VNFLVFVVLSLHPLYYHHCSGLLAVPPPIRQTIWLWNIAGLCVKRSLKETSKYNSHATPRHATPRMKVSE